MSLQDTYGRKVELDTAAADTNSGYLISMDVEHHKIHEGDHYTCCDYDDDIDAAGPKYWHIITPNTTARCHLAIVVSMSGPGLFEVFENPTTSANGTGLTEYNNDRNSSNATTIAAYKDPTVSVDGTLIGCHWIGTAGASPVGAKGAVVSRTKELILKQNEQYLFKFTAENDNTKGTIGFDWYEV